MILEIYDLFVVKNKLGGKIHLATIDTYDESTTTLCGYRTNGITEDNWEDLDDKTVNDFSATFPLDKCVWCSKELERMKKKESKKETDKANNFYVLENLQTGYLHLGIKSEYHFTTLCNKKINGFNKENWTVRKDASVNDFNRALNTCKCTTCTFFYEKMRKNNKTFPTTGYLHLGIKSDSTKGKQEMEQKKYWLVHNQSSGAYQLCLEEEHAHDMAKRFAKKLPETVFTVLEVVSAYQVSSQPFSLKIVEPEGS